MHSSCINLLLLTIFGRLKITRLTLPRRAMYRSPAKILTARSGNANQYNQSESFISCFQLRLGQDGGASCGENQALVFSSRQKYTFAKIQYFWYLHSMINFTYFVACTKHSAMCCLCDCLLLTQHFRRPTIKFVRFNQNYVAT